MKKIIAIASLAVLLGMVATMLMCDKSKNDKDSGGKGRRIVQQITDPSGKWTALVDEVEYANGIMTSVADRVCLIGPGTKGVDGKLVFSEDAMTDNEKPSISWSANHLVVSFSKNANVLQQQKEFGGIEIEYRRR